jgi:hypothetical protein
MVYGQQHAGFCLLIADAAESQLVLKGHCAY